MRYVFVLSVIGPGRGSFLLRGILFTGQAQGFCKETIWIVAVAKQTKKQSELITIINTHPG